MVTQTARADMTFYFYGIGVQLYGAKRSNHGQYQISIDSKVYNPVNGSAPDPGNFQASLFNTVALENGYHTVRLTNLESNYLDLDFVCCAGCFFIVLSILNKRFTYRRRLHGKPQSAKPTTLLSLRLCRIRTHRSSTPRRISGIQALPMLVYFWEVRASMCIQN